MDGSGGSAFVSPGGTAKGVMETPRNPQQYDNTQQQATGSNRATTATGSGVANTLNK